MLTLPARLAGNMQSGFRANPTIYIGEFSTLRVSKVRLRKLFGLLAIVEAVLLIALVPIARALERHIYAALTLLGLSIWNVLIVAFIAALTASGCYYLWLLRRKRLPLVVLHGLSLTIIELVIISHIGDIVAEYAHIVSYAALYIFIRLALHGSRLQSPWIPLITFLLAALVGGLDEGFQAFTPGRVAEWRDAMTNVIGAGVGAAYIEAALTPFGSRRQQHPLEA